MVFEVKSNTQYNVAAVKVHYSPEPYTRERDIYQRLRDCEVTDLRGFEVPMLLHFDDELLALQMTIVTAPFVLDFAGAYLDFPPSFSNDVWEQWTMRSVEQFGPDWALAQIILADLRDLGIHMHDPTPSNIRFR